MENKTMSCIKTETWKLPDVGVGIGRFLEGRGKGQIQLHT